MGKIYIFGAGAVGRTAVMEYKNKGYKIEAFIDNNTSLYNETVLGIPVIPLDKLHAERIDFEIVVAVSIDYRYDVVKQLEMNGYDNFHIFNQEALLKKERFLSYSYKDQLEDLILYHVLKGEKNVFWIDVGCNDPDLGSVTKAFYERGYRGINIDIEPGIMEIVSKKRKRDINICAGIGSRECEAEFYSQGDWGGLSTFVEDNCLSKKKETKTIYVTTLKKICDDYISNQRISFLKIDVEGMEKEVLCGMDFSKYRPKIVVVEATLPRTNIYNYTEWEDILIDGDYLFAYEHGVNRYYVACEYAELIERFEPWEQMVSQYCVLSVNILYAV